MNHPPLNNGINLDEPVVCRTCKRGYMCTPYDDYYGSTDNMDGQCERCLLTEAGLGEAKVVTVVVEPKERPFPAGDPVRVHRSSGTIEDDWEVEVRHPMSTVVRKWYSTVGEYVKKHVPNEMFDAWQDEMLAEKYPFFVQWWNLSREMEDGGEHE